MMGAILLLHAFGTLSMLGIIWFVQLVHYPLMAHVHGESFPMFEVEHQRRTTWVVAPLMLIEAGTATFLLFVPQVVPPALAWVGIASLAGIWVSTFFWQVPYHARLEKAFFSHTHKRLVQTNWLRTTLWTLRGGIACLMLFLQ